MITDWDAYDSTWVPLDEQIQERAKALRQILAEVRRSLAIPMADVVRELRSVTALKAELKAAPRLRKIDRDELAGRLTGNQRALEFLREWSRSFTRPTPETVRVIKQEREKARTKDEILSSCRRRTELLLLARPDNREFWDFARTLMADIEAELKLADKADAIHLLRFKSTIHWVAPAWVFKDRSQYGTNTRYGYRMVEIQKVVAGGLPGHGKRS